MESRGHLCHRASPTLFNSGFQPLSITLENTRLPKHNKDRPASSTQVAKPPPGSLSTTSSPGHHRARAAMHHAASASESFAGQ